MNLFNEIRDMELPVDSRNAKVHCKVFEDNLGVLEIVRTPKLRPRKKHFTVDFITSVHM